MTEVMRIANKHNLKVLEDCAQAHNAEWDGKKVGTIGDVGSFSFYPGKNLGAYGDAGAIVTNNADVAKKVRMLANHGQLQKHEHLMEGRNSRMDGLQAAILRAKLPHLEFWTNSRIDIAKTYQERITNPKLQLPSTHKLAKHVFHLFVIRTAERNKVIEQLKSKQIGFSIHYPTALPFMPCYMHLGLQELEFPVAAKYQDQILSIPMFAELTIEQIKYIVDEIDKV